MKKYKLIKKLPFENSPEIGYISTKVTGSSGVHYWNQNWFHPEEYPEFWQEVKEPVFISDDGVEMFLGDIYWSSFTDFSDISSQEITDTTPKDNVFSFKRFSTKEAALKYIDLNKPKYSKSDVIDALRIAEYYSGFRKPSGEEVIKHLFGE